MINLAEETIDKSDLIALTEWLDKNPRLTKGQETEKFEQEWSSWQGQESSVFVNSGSSANFMMFHALLYSNLLKNKKVVVPSISWVTTVSPAMLLGYEPIPCDCDSEDLGLCLSDFERICQEESPSIAIVVHVLGHSNKMKEISEICERYDVILLEDCCEAYGAYYMGQKVGSFGLMSSFSFYFGHHMSTIEGGMVSTSNRELKNILLSIRSHGWLRDVDDDFRQRHIKKHNITEFESLFTFVYPGMNLRSTDLSAFIGRRQLEKLDGNIDNRDKNYRQYKALLEDHFWVQTSETEKVSCLGFALMADNREKIAKSLFDNDIECRPLVCGSIQEQPFWDRKKRDLPSALKVHNNGFYVPCHDKLSENDIKFISNIVLESK
jgi:CDP-6-deoxy-D-xylo-4-hexulose-3-dehydrase